MTTPFSVTLPECALPADFNKQHGLLAKPYKHLVHRAVLEQHMGEFQSFSTNPFQLNRKGIADSSRTWQNSEKHVYLFLGHPHQVADQLPRPTKDSKGLADIGKWMSAAEIVHLIHRAEQQATQAQMQRQCVMVDTSRDMHDALAAMTFSHLPPKSSEERVDDTLNSLYTPEDINADQMLSEDDITLGMGGADASTPGPDAGSTASARAAALEKILQRMRTAPATKRKTKAHAALKESALAEQEQKKKGKKPATVAAAKLPERLGPDECVNYNKDSFDDTYANDPAAFIVELIGGANVARSIKVLKKNGHFHHITNLGWLPNVDKDHGTPVGLLCIWKGYATALSHLPHQGLTRRLSCMYRALNS
ncbi:hypothetical protein ABBQ32_009157 [Trebouxia sp. C0010 RCD-2024]